METKRCSKCGEEKPISEFPKSKGYKNGIRSVCRKCKYVTDKKWRESHREHLREYRRRYMKAYRERKRNVPIEAIERYPGEACYLAKARRLMRGEVVDPHCVLGEGDTAEVD